ncbi:hypothetical protein [Intrasporangium sp.]|uniref:hypothetical protein n=1 Tax=Intrasporangium sp. TaxID=1925024 RepID=UPI0032218621
MTGRPHPSAWQELLADPITFFGTVMLTALMLPTLAPRLRDRAIAWLLTHAVLVPAPAAVVTIPTTGVGLDGRRLVIALLALVLAIAWATASARRRRDREHRS